MVELYSFQICGALFLLINVLIIWLMMVPLIQQMNEPLEFNRTEVENMDTYDDEDRQAFKDAFGSFIPDEVLDEIEPDNMAEVLEAGGIGVDGLDGFIENMGNNGMGL